MAKQEDGVCAHPYIQLITSLIYVMSKCVSAVVHHKNRCERMATPRISLQFCDTCISPSLVPRPSHRPVFDCKQSKTGRWEGLGKMLHSSLKNSLLVSSTFFWLFSHSSLGICCAGVSSVFTFPLLTFSVSQLPSTAIMFMHG